MSLVSRAHGHSTIPRVDDILQRGEVVEGRDVDVEKGVAVTHLLTQAHTHTAVEEGSGKASEPGTGSDTRASETASLSQPDQQQPSANAVSAAPSADVVLGGFTLTRAHTCIVFWITMSCSVILFNKFLYYGTFPYPLTLTSIHMLFATVVTWALRLTGRLTAPALDTRTLMRSILPIGVLYATSLGTSNIGAARLTVSFVQMIKALTPLVTLLVSVIAGTQTSTRTQTYVVCIMCVGVFIASYGEIMWDTVGVMFQVTSVVAEGTRLVATELLLQNVLPKSNPLVSISFFAPACAIFLAPIAYTFEPTALTALLDSKVAMVVFLNACVAFVLNLAVVLLVQHTSGLMLTLAGIVKDVMLIIASIFLYANPVMPLQVFGYLVALIGLNMYNEMKARKNETLGLRDLLRLGITNRQAVFIAVGCMVLLSISLTSKFSDRV